MDERRQVSRARSFMGASIVFNKGDSSMECVVRNLSDHGARVAFSGTVLFPDEFKLAIAQKAASHRARVVWRNPKEAGIAFEHSV